MRFEQITRDIERLDTSYEEWQIVYRQALQLARAIHGEPQLLAGARGDDEDRPHVTHRAEEARRA